MLLDMKGLNNIRKVVLPEEIFQCCSIAQYTSIISEINTEIVAFFFVSKFNIASSGVYPQNFEWSSVLVRGNFWPTF